MEKVKRGYLNGDYHLFHIRDKKELEVGYHYHEFDKAVVFISGRVTYVIEGKSYFLKPWDILLIRHDQIHSTKIDGSQLYERIVIYLTPEFLEREGLSRCFEMASDSNFSLVRADKETRLSLLRHISCAEESGKSSAFGAKIMERTSILQLLVEISRVFSPEKAEEGAFRSDPKIEEIIRYIKENLAGDLTAQTLCDRFFISRSYLMHSFKAETGYTLHGYIVQKRLMYAAELIKDGESVTDASTKSGFSDYSAFLRAFKKAFGVLPKSYIK